MIVDSAAEDMDPAHETTMAWVLREAVTNVVKHSGASKCQIAIHASGGSSTLEVQDDGRGPAGSASGTGLDRLNDRVSASGGTLQVGPADGRGFRVRVQLGAAVTAALGKPVAP